MRICYLLKRKIQPCCKQFENIYPNLKTAILNFADYLTPGGGYLNGSELKKKCYVMNLIYIQY